VGETFSNPSKRRLDDNKALAELNFQVTIALELCPHFAAAFTIFDEQNPDFQSSSMKSVAFLIL